MRKFWMAFVIMAMVLGLTGCAKKETKAPVEEEAEEKIEEEETPIEEETEESEGLEEMEEVPEAPEGME